MVCQERKTGNIQSLNIVAHTPQSLQSICPFFIFTLDTNVSLSHRDCTHMHDHHTQTQKHQQSWVESEPHSFADSKVSSANYLMAPPALAVPSHAHTRTCTGSRAKLMCQGESSWAYNRSGMHTHNKACLNNSSNFYGTITTTLFVVN